MEAPVRVLLLGYGHMGLALLRGLLQTPHCQIVGVYRWSVRKKGKSGWEKEEAAFGSLIRKRRLPELDCGPVNGFAFRQKVEELKPDLILIGSWGEILKGHLLADQPFYVVNCHPSLLPAHRGANPYVSAIRTGETETGVSFHLVSEAIDAGPILVQERVPILPDDSGMEVRAKCGALAEALVGHVIEHYRAGAITEGIPQDESRQSYFPQLKMEEGQLNWDTDPPVNIFNQIRGLYPWLPCFCFAEGQVMVSVVRAVMQTAEPPCQGHEPGRVVAVKKGVAWVATLDPAVLIGLTQYRFYCGAGFLPAWLCRWMAPAMLRPGTRLGRPYWQQHWQPPPGQTS